jgi:hypothetical protein
MAENKSVTVIYIGRINSSVMVSGMGDAYFITYNEYLNSGKYNYDGQKRY